MHMFLYVIIKLDYLCLYYTTTLTIYIFVCYTTIHTNTALTFSVLYNFEVFQFCVTFTFMYIIQPWHVLYYTTWRYIAIIFMYIYYTNILIN